MSKKRVHIVSFDVPYPPNYGGVIDVYYKIEALYKKNIAVILHTYEYGRKKQKKLERICSEVHYYKRTNNLLTLLHYNPFIIQTRNNNTLIKRLQSDSDPIIFEGLHTTYPILKDDRIRKRSYIRTHNIEHLFYNGLMKSEINLMRKIFFKLESIKLKHYEKKLNLVKGILAISPDEQSYFTEKYGKKSAYIPVFHPMDTLKHEETKNNIILFHGDLRVPDNKKAALFIIDTFKKTEFNVFIATSRANKRILKLIDKYDNIHLKSIPTQKELNALFKQAHINILLTFQKTGIKLKLLNTLYKGKFIITNKAMIENTGLQNLCNCADTPDEMLIIARKLTHQKFKNTSFIKRMLVLSDFNTAVSAQKIIDKIFN